MNKNLERLKNTLKAPVSPATVQGYNSTSETENGDTGENMSDTARISLTMQQDDHARTLEAYQNYQKNIAAAAAYQTELTEGIKRGESPYNLLLTAVKAIGAMTGNTTFPDRIKGDVIAVYGWGLDEKPPLQWELDSVRERLKRLETNLDQTPDKGARDRIEAAIMAHENRIEELERKLKTDEYITDDKTQMEQLSMFRVSDACNGKRGDV